MRRVAIVVGILVLIVSLPLFSAKKSGPPRSVANFSLADVNVTTLTGPEAAGYVAQREQSDPNFKQGQALSRQHLAKRGYTAPRDFTVYMFQPKPEPVGWFRGTIGAIVPALKAQSYDGDGGWVTFTGYGGADTWVGNIYINDGAGLWESIDAEHDTMSMDVYWAYRVGGNGDRERPTRGGGGLASAIGGALSNFSNTVCPAVGAQGDRCPCLSGRAAECIVVESYRESRDNCASMFTGCTMRGAGWWPCVGYTCGARSAWALVSNMRKWHCHCLPGDC